VTETGGGPAEAALTAERCRAQLLTGPPADSVTGVVRHLLAVQGQDPRGFRLSVRVRSAGLVIAEAMARKLPVIASHIGGPAEILTHEANGLLVTPGDEQALAMAIRRLLDDRALRARLGASARQTVEERFTIESDARHVEQHLLRAIQAQKKL